MNMNMNMNKFIAKKHNHIYYIMWPGGQVIH